jgi:outer membrane lipoprotein-sorting protein
MVASLAIGVVSGLGWIGMPASAGEPDATEAKSDSGDSFSDEPAAHALYDQMVEAMRKANSLSFTSHYVWEARGKTLGDSTYQAWLKKPNYFRVETELASGEKRGVLVGDGDHLWIYWPQGRPGFYGLDPDEATRLTSYMTKRTPQGRHSIGHEVALLGAGMSMPILDPSTFHGYTDSLQPYLDGVKSLGSEAVDGEECDKIELSLMKHQRSWVLWLSRQDHLPRKLEQTIRVSYDIVMHEQWSSVTLDGEIPETLFAWSPPEGWTRYTLPDPDDLLLKPGAVAPDFDLESADGSRIKLSDYRGKVIWFYIWRAG